MEIKSPRGKVLINNKTMKAEVVWSPLFENSMNRRFGIGSPLQNFVDSEFMNDIKPYMPFKQGVLISSMTLNTVIGQGVNITRTPYARFLYYGKLMVDSVTGSAWALPGGTKVVTDIDLVFHGGSKRGSFWDKRWASGNLNQFTNKIQRFVDRGGS